MASDFSLLKCEVLTAIHYKEVSEYLASEDIRGFGYGVEYFKVLDRDFYTLEVYYIAEENSYAETVILEKRFGKWERCSFGHTVWTNLGGSADDVVWPYWHHAFTRQNMLDGKPLLGRRS